MSDFRMAPHPCTSHGCPMKMPAVPRGIWWWAFVAIGCQATDVIEARFQSRAIEAVTREIRAFVFSTDPPSCVDLDPRGSPPGDAEERSGTKSTLSFVGPPGDELLAELEDVPVGRTTIVIEAWGPPCAEVGGTSDEPICNRLASAGDPVLRGYWCNTIDLSATRSLDLIAELETFAQIGSSLSVPASFPANAVHYDDDAPLFVTDGLPGRDRFTVQVLNHLAEAVDGVPVRFAIA